MKLSHSIISNRNKQSNSSDGRSYVLIILAFIFITSMVMVVLLPSNPINMPVSDRDSGVFLYTGWRILRGDIPYKDVWDHKPPIIFFIDAFGLAISHESTWGVWSIEFVSLLLATLIAFLLNQKIFGTLPAIIATIIGSFSLTFIIVGGNLTTEYTLPMQFGAIWIFSQAKEEKYVKLSYFIIGVLGGLAFFTKQNSVGIWIVMMVMIGIEIIRSNKWSNLIHQILPILIGGLTITVIVILYFLINNSLYNFWDSAFRYNFFYSKGEEMSIVFQKGYEYYITAGAAPIIVIAWILGFGNILFHKKSVAQNKMDWLLLLAVFDLPVECLLISISGRYHPHYFMTLIPSISILVAFLFYIIQIGAMHYFQSDSGFIRFMINALLVTSVIIFGLPSIQAYKELIDHLKRFSNQSLVNYIQSETTTDDSVLFWGAEAKYNFFTKRKAPTKFVYQLPLNQPGYANQDNIEAFYNDIVTNEPHIIIDTLGNGIYTNTFEITSTRIDLLMSSLQSMYYYVGKFGIWGIYIDEHDINLQKVVNDKISIYIYNNRLIYRITNCESEDVKDRFFIHIYPEDLNDLPQDRTVYGMDNLDFYFNEHGYTDGTVCFAVRDLPNYPFVRIISGQNVGEQVIWQAEFLLN